AARRFDVAVIGGGPAGGSAAWQLARSGRSVVICEKESLPRYKPCGAGISRQLAGWFDFSLEPVINRRIRQVRFTWCGGDPIALELPEDQALWLTRREPFDMLLLQEAQRHGANLLAPCRVTAVTREPEGWLLQTDTGPISASWVILAEGAKGTLSAPLGFSTRRFIRGAALEAEIPHSHPTDTAVVDFGRVKFGYGWVFPKADGYSIGIGSFKGGEEPNLVKLLEELVRESGLDLAQGKWFGHPVLLWDGDFDLHADRALLVGEAAGCVDPFTAEGIRWAAFTGLRAAESVTKCLNGNYEAASEYTKLVQKEFGSEMNWARKLAAAYFHLGKLAYKGIVKRPGAGLAMMRLLSGDLRYSQVAERALARLNPLNWLRF
ncbi:MAG TPA: geranylgeranyl reductase family protein, partial [Candidatus Ozemobacteraceae bacterium]|nr:geranylgeranyl reductase family protein [Candidatus Ozemobacteraceae bacterium]